jgi:hypothetical protein
MDPFAASFRHSITTSEWTSMIDFFTRIDKACTPFRQKFILSSDVLGVYAVVDALNNPASGNRRRAVS